MHLSYPSVHPYVRTGESVLRIEANHPSICTCEHINPSYAFKLTARPSVRVNLLLDKIISRNSTLELNVRVELKVKRRKMEEVKANRDIKEERIRKKREIKEGKRREEEEMYEGEISRKGVNEKERECE